MSHTHNPLWVRIIDIERERVGPPSHPTFVREFAPVAATEKKRLMDGWRIRWNTWWKKIAKAILRTSSLMALLLERLAIRYSLDLSLAAPILRTHNYEVMDGHKDLTR